MGKLLNILSQNISEQEKRKGIRGKDGNLLFTQKKDYTNQDNKKVSSDDKFPNQEKIIQDYIKNKFGINTIIRIVSDEITKSHFVEIEYDDSDEVFNNCSVGLLRNSLYFDVIIKGLHGVNIGIGIKEVWNQETRHQIKEFNKNFRQKFYEKFPEFTELVKIKIDFSSCINNPIVYVAFLQYPYNDEQKKLPPSSFKLGGDKKTVSKIRRYIKKELPNSKIRIGDTARDDFGNNITWWVANESYRDDDPQYFSKEEQEQDRLSRFNSFSKKVQTYYGGIYDYEYDDFQDLNTPIEVWCKQHERYFTVTPKQHLKGKKCPHDNESKGETAVRSILEKNNIQYKQYHKMKGCFVMRNERCILLTFDFYLPNNNTIIEYDGRQHYEPVNYFGGKESFQRQVTLDAIKNDFCKDNKINLIRIPYTVKNRKDIEKFIKERL